MIALIAMALIGFFLGVLVTLASILFIIDWDFGGS